MLSHLETRLSRTVLSGVVLGETPLFLDYCKSGGVSAAQEIGRDIAHMSISYQYGTLSEGLKIPSLAMKRLSIATKTPSFAQNIPKNCLLFHEGYMKEPFT